MKVDVCIPDKPTVTNSPHVVVTVRGIGIICRSFDMLSSPPSDKRKMLDDSPSLITIHPCRTSDRRGYSFPEKQIPRRYDGVQKESLLTLVSLLLKNLSHLTRLGLLRNAILRV